MSAQQNFFSIYGNGPNPTPPFWSRPELVRPSKQWRDSPLFTAEQWRVTEGEEEKEEGGEVDLAMTSQWC